MKDNNTLNSGATTSLSLVEDHLGKNVVRHSKKKQRNADQSNATQKSQSKLDSTMQLSANGNQAKQKPTAQKLTEHAEQSANQSQVKKQKPTAQKPNKQGKQNSNKQKSDKQNSSKKTVPTTNVAEQSQNINTQKTAKNSQKVAKGKQKAPKNKKNSKKSQTGNGKQSQVSDVQPQVVSATKGEVKKMSIQQTMEDYNKVNLRNPLRYQQPLGKLKIIFLGGVGEIGKNMTAFEYGNSIVILDCGMSFPGTDMPGVDVVIPDVTYLVENRDKIKGILLTHGHEDHIGSLPFVVARLGGKINVYGTKLTLGLVENKLLEHNMLEHVNLVSVSDKSIVTLDDFSAEFIHVSHSVAGSVAIALRTPVGTVFHTGDFKIDYTPLGNEIMNLNRIAEIGKQGVLLLMSESTNVEKTGYTMSESVVQDTINKVFQDAKGRRIIIATFASNVDRLGMIIELAKQYRRKIVLSGRSMQRYIETAVRVGQMTVDADMIVDIDKIGNYEDGKLVILATGSQGEPMSALTRMADGEFNKVNIGANDTIVISANPIPGNERDVYNVINKLYRLGAVVVYSALQAVHVSGHACQEELKLMYSLIKPKYFIPVHGEYRHLKQHSMLVEKLGQKRSNIIIPDIGDVVEVDKSTFKVVGQVQGGNVLVDGLGVGDVGNIVLKDRLSLAEEGILVCVVAVNKDSGEIIGKPEVVSRGCFFFGDGQGDNNPAEEIKRLVANEIATVDRSHGSNINGIKTAIQRCARKYFRVTLKRNPMILPVVVEV